MGAGEHAQWPALVALLALLRAALQGIWALRPKPGKRLCLRVGAEAVLEGSPDGGDSLWLVEIELLCSGAAAVLEEDFRGDLVVGFQDGASPLLFGSATVGPEGVRAEVVCAADEIRVAPLLLNPGDVLRICAYVRRFPVYRLAYRIAGVAEIERAKGRVRRRGRRLRGAGRLRRGQRVRGGA